MKLKIKNFQSIEDITLEIPENSFTCIVGSSNIGKSAIRRALEAILYNKSELSYIRNGCSLCEVTLTFNDGDTLSWFRDDKTSWYIMGNQKFSKLNKTVPDILLNKGFKELVIGKEKLNIQVASQFDNIFLLNKSGGFITEVISNLGNLNKIINSNKACTSDISKSKEKIAIRKEDLKNVILKINSFEGLDSSVYIIKNLKNSISELKKDIDIKDKLEGIRSNLEISAKKLKSLKECSSVEIPDSDVDVSGLQNLTTLNNQYEKLSVLVDYYKDINNINTDINIPEVDKFIKLLKIYSEYSSLDKKVSYYKYISSISIPEKEELDVTTCNKLYNAYKSVTTTKSSIIKLREEISNLDKKLEDLLNQEQELHKEIKVCPLCERTYA